MITPVASIIKPTFPGVVYLEKLKGELADARYLQITYLACFLCYGMAQLHWEIPAQNFFTTLFVATGTQLIAATITKQPLSSVKSALITVLGISILLRGANVYVFAVAAFIAIASKFIIRFKGKHIINPGNFGIIAAILITGQAWISPGQWGNTAALLFMIGAAGMMVVLKVGRLDLALPFLLTYGGLELLRTVLYQGWPMDFFWHKILNGSLMLFTFFMITDPKSTPNHKAGRIIFSVVIGILTFYLANYKFVNGAPIWALFFLSPLTILLDKLFKANSFNWKKPNYQNP
jgi:Na+-transporting NADH:ubiquinone oxidoreductase subunit NqrB